MVNRSAQKTTGYVALKCKYKFINAFAQFEYIYEDVVAVLEA